MTTHTSVIQILASRSVTGRGLGLSVHKHWKQSIHLAWNPVENRKGVYQNCIARHTIQLGVWYEVERQLRSRKHLTGRCKCIYGTNVGYWKETLDETCYYTCRKTRIGVKFHCRCTVNFSLEFGENYKSSVFLPGGTMILCEAAHKGIGQC